jgi:hypothetical protein
VVEVAGATGVERWRRAIDGSDDNEVFSDEPAQGSLQIVFQLGVTSLQCTTFGGDVVRDVPTGAPTPLGNFLAVDAPPVSGTCPTP